MPASGLLQRHNRHYACWVKHSAAQRPTYQHPHISTHHGPVHAKLVRNGQQQIVLCLAPYHGPRHGALRVRGAHGAVPRHGPLAAAAAAHVRLLPQLLLALVGVLFGGVAVGQGTR